MNAEGEGTMQYTHATSESRIAPQRARPKIKFRNIPAGMQGRHLMLLRSYCKRAANAARARAKKVGVPCDITGDDLERMLDEQGYRCAVSGIVLETPPSADERRFRQVPFGPSLDRIIPARGYVRDNIRITCSIVNTAMNEWGLDALLRVVDAMKARRP